GPLKMKHTGGLDTVAIASRQIEPISHSLLEQALASTQAPVALAVRIVSRHRYTKDVVEELHICTVFFCRSVSSVKVNLQICANAGDSYSCHHSLYQVVSRINEHAL